MWQQLGHCQHSTKYMAHYCRKSCGMCDEEVTSESKKVAENIQEL
ncbi:hypothetical protein COOONC_13456 [Cooperia oncophora]